MTIVQKLKVPFSNFEEATIAIPKNKVELSGSKTAITIDKWNPKNSKIRQGVNYDFVRFYQGKSEDSKHLSVGFSFSFEEDAPIVVAIHENNKRYIRTVSVEEFKILFKSLIKEINSKDVLSFVNLIGIAYNIFDFESGDSFEYFPFDIMESSEKALNATIEDRKIIEDIKVAKNNISSSILSLEQEKCAEIRLAIEAIEEKFKPKINPLKEELFNLDQQLENQSIAYVEKIKSTFDNHAMGVEKYVISLVEKLPYPELIVPYIMKN